MSNPNQEPVFSFINSQPSIKIVVLSLIWALRVVDAQGVKGFLDSLVTKGKAPIITDDVPSSKFGSKRCVINKQSVYQPLRDQGRALF
ncbi:hypothetical protein N9P34_00655 [Actinomycetota bacterium]|nr:hypothetical protein [Actinomycetota bacterium]